MATTEEKFDELNQMITDHYDIIPQEDWYVFYEKAMDAVNDVAECYTGEVQAHVHWMRKYLTEAGDVPYQEQWFDICSEVYGLEEELGNAGIIEASFFVRWARLFE